MKVLLVVLILSLVGCTNLYMSDRAILVGENEFLTIVEGSTKTRTFNMLVGIMKSRCEVEQRPNFEVIEIKQTQTGEVTVFETRKTTKEVWIFTESQVENEVQQGFEIEAKFRCVA
ncbi:hypothetical protein [Vibrio sp. WXL103]|uniref:hypothetical protein n=1 Tax=unclassified Vibrio TaxID=2614977 RepID=UPI003EC69A4E